MNRTGKRSVIGMALAVIGALALAVPGVAGTKTNTGKVDGDGNATVVAKVQVKNGKPKKLTKLQFRQVDLHCHRGYADSESDAKFTDVKVNKHGKKYEFSIGQIDQYGRRAASGTVKKNGTKVKGSVNFSNAFCMGGGTFTAKR